MQVETGRVTKKGVSEATDKIYPVGHGEGSLVGQNRCPCCPEMFLTCNALFVPLGKEHECLGISLWGLEQSLAVGVLSNALQNGSNSS